tara:strand:+ start:393 stop:773 length:381 start_codon:yes stop_codon:yes gene_type:complete
MTSFKQFKKGLRVKKPLWETFKNSKFVIDVFAKHFYKKRKKKVGVDKDGQVEKRHIRQLVIKQMNVIQDLAFSLQRAEQLIDHYREEIKNLTLTATNRHKEAEHLRAAYTDLKKSLNGGSHETIEE